MSKGFATDNLISKKSKKKVVSKGPASSPDLPFYAPKEAHSRIFVTGGSIIAWQMLAKKYYKLASPRKAFYLATFFSI